MRKTKLTALISAAAIYVGVLTTPLMAGSFGIGIAGVGLLAETDGTETLKTTSVKSSKSEDGVGLVASGYVQYRFGDNGFVIGIEKIPGSATLGDGTLSRTDWVEASTTVGSTVTQLAKAKLSNHFGAYIETPSLGGLYAMVGYEEVDLTTQESLETGASYPDDTLNGTTVGIGFKGTSENGLHLKFLATRTDYDHVTLKSSGSDAISTIDGDIKTYGIKLSVGYNF